MASASIKGLGGIMLSYIPLLVVIYAIVSSVRAWYSLRRFKGPWLGSFSYAFMAKTAASGRMHEVYANVSRKYGSLARVGPNDLVTDDPDIIRLMSSARSTYKRSNWYATMSLDPYVDNIFSVMDVGVHDGRRAKMAGAYAGKENPNLDADIDDQVASFISLIRQKYLSDNTTFRPMDFGRKAQFFTLDVISKVAYGKAFGFLERDEDVHGYIETTEAVVPFLAFLSTVPLANAIINRSWVKSKLGPKVTDKNGMGKLMGVAREVVSERFGDSKIEKTDMLGAFVRNGLEQRQVESEVLFQIIAGSDTTATAVRSTFLYLVSSPYVLMKLCAEIDEAEAAERLSNPITNSEAKAMPYLQAVIKEGLRLCPPFTGLVMKEVPRGGDNINGHFVPGGTRIGHSIWAVQRGPIYGKDPEVFRPERWTEADKEAQMKMDQTLDLNFGYGRWGCLGKSVAYVELNKIFVQLLRNFDFQLVNPGKPWVSVNYNLFMQDHMSLRVTQRERKVQ